MLALLAYQTARIIHKRVPPLAPASRSLAMLGLGKLLAAPIDYA